MGGGRCRAAGRGEPLKSRPGDLCGPRTTAASGALCSASGLATLEWLLVVAAVAGLAAVAVVAIQDTIGGTAQRIESHSARLQAADLAANQIEDRWRAQKPNDDAHAKRINDRYRPRCRQLAVIYADVLVGVEATDGLTKAGKPGQWDGTPYCVLVPIR